MISLGALTALSSYTLLQNPGYHTEYLLALSMWSKAATQCRGICFSPTPSWQ